MFNNIIKHQNFYSSLKNINNFSFNLSDFYANYNIWYNFNASTLVKSNKNKNFFCFVDGNKSPLVIMRLARDVHISFTLKKTLRNIRYKYFLKKQIRSYSKFQFYTFNLSYLIRLYKFSHSWYQSILLISYGLIWVNNKQIFFDFFLQPYDIFQISYFKGFSLFQIFFKKRFTTIKKKLKKAKYTYGLSKRKRWVIKKKNSTRFLFWLKNFSNINTSCLLFDFFTYTGVVLPIFSKYITFNKYEIIHSSVIKLSAWKFRAR